MTRPEVLRECAAVAIGVVLGLVMASAVSGVTSEPGAGVLALIVIPMTTCAIVLRPRTSRGIVPAVAVTVGIEVIAVVVLIALFWQPGG